MVAGITLIVRHAERPPLVPGDLTFGADLPLTPKGERDALEYGRRLYARFRGGRLFVQAGSTRRTVDTAAFIKRGWRDADGEVGDGDIHINPVLGSESPYFGDVVERLRFAAKGNYHERLNEYIRNGMAPGFRPLSAATEEFERRLCADMHECSVNVLVTHDINVAMFLAGRRVETRFTETSWPNYLDAAVIVVDAAAGHVSYSRFDFSSNLPN